MMSKRKPLVGGNWKMNLDNAKATALAKAIVEQSPKTDGVDVILYPSFPHLVSTNKVLSPSNIKLGAQDFCGQPNGAYTGAVSLSMLSDVGASAVLAGHSERRHVFGETDEQTNAKVRWALEAGFYVTLCVGETHEQRQQHQTDAINAAQIHYGLAGVEAEQMPRLSIAYEPVWAIGTGKTATPEDAQTAHFTIRAAVAARFNNDVAAETRIQYGGSVKPDNAGQLFAQPDVDGGLIGGASLVAQDFLAIVEAAAG